MSGQSWDCACVMPGLVPGIHVLFMWREDVDGPNKLSQ